MTTQYTPYLGLALPVEGELDGSWGTTVNDSITSLLDEAVAGFATADVSSGNWTLSTTGSGLPNEARVAILIPTGTPGVSRNIVAPSSSKTYVVINQSDATVVLKGSATTGVTIPTGATVFAVWNGSDFVNVSPVASLAAGLVKSTGSNGFTSVAAPTGAVVGTTDTQVISNKEIQRRVVTTATASSITIDGETTDVAVMANTGTGTFTVNAPSGTPVDGQSFVFRLKSTNVLTFSWNAIFQGSTAIPLPASSSGSGKYDYLGFMYNSANSKWQLVGLNLGVAA